MILLFYIFASTAQEILLILSLSFFKLSVQTYILSLNFVLTLLHESLGVETHIYPYIFKVVGTDIYYE